MIMLEWYVANDEIHTAYELPFTLTHESGLRMSGVKFTYLGQLKDATGDLICDWYSNERMTRAEIARFKELAALRVEVRP